LRTVVFFQGCSLGCRGCFNPDTHLFRRVEVAPAEAVETLRDTHRKRSLEGIASSGGEPMQQADSLLALLQALQNHAPELSFGMFSGYTERELNEGRYAVWGRKLKGQEKRVPWEAIRPHLDFAVLGRFNRFQPISEPLRSDQNQVLRLFSSRYRESDFGEQLAEVNIYEDGRLEGTGFRVLDLPWQRSLQCLGAIFLMFTRGSRL